MANTKTLERDIEKGFEEVLNSMNEKEFEEYFKKLIEKYYSVIFSFEEDPSKYYADSTKKYEMIKKVKAILKFKYNNLDNYENLERLKQAENIAYKQMLELNSMETNYSNIIYHTKTQELILINETLNNLIDLYKKDSSEEILSVIEKMLESIVILVKEAKKLPLYEKEELYKDITYKKEYFKKLSDKEKEDLPEVIEETILVKPFLSLGLKEQLERFNSIVEELEVILPAAVITDFYLKLNSSEKIDFLKFMLETKTEDETEEEIYKIVAYLDYLKKKNDNNYLYNKIQSWS